MGSSCTSRFRGSQFLSAAALLLILTCCAAADTLSDAVALLRHGELSAAEQTLRTELKTHPDNADALGLLGIVLDNERKFDEAERIYRRALELNGHSSALLNNYGNHLLNVKDLNAAQKVFLRLLAANPEHRNGNLQMARIAIEQQHASEALAYLEHIPESERSGRDVALLRIEALYLSGRARDADTVVSELTPAAHTDAQLASSLGLALADSHQYARAGTFFQEAIAAAPATGEYVQAVTDVGSRLVDAGEYKEAEDFLRPIARASACWKVQMELAIAASHAQNPQAGLAILDDIPVSQRTGDYYLARAEMLDAAGQFEQAAAALSDGLHADPKRPDLYRQAVMFLVKNDRVSQAISVAEEGARVLPDDRDMLLLKATTLELAGKTDEAEALLDNLRRRWPQWPNAWLTEGIILETYKRYEEARQMVEKAVALGARSSEAYFYLAESLLYTSPERIDAAQKNIRQAVALAPDDPWIRALAGRIAFAKKDYGTAVEELQQAIRLRPNLVQAHYLLAQTYKALGKVQQSREELEQVSMIHQRSPNDEADTSDVKRALFPVRPLESH